jgi:hypothetical protein
VARNVAKKQAAREAIRQIMAVATVIVGNINRGRGKMPTSKRGREQRGRRVRREK